MNLLFVAKLHDWVFFLNLGIFFSPVLNKSVFEFFVFVYELAGYINRI